MATIQIYDGYPDADTVAYGMDSSGRVIDELDNEACMRRAGLPLADTYMIVGGKAVACSVEEFSRSASPQVALALVPTQRAESPDFHGVAVA